MKRKTKRDDAPLTEDERQEARERVKRESLLEASERQVLREKALDSLRTIAWFRALCEQVGVHGYRASDLENHWVRFATDDKHAGLHHVDWRPYARGSQRPSEKTLHLVEMHYPGTRKMYEVGELNMWAILRGDIAACTAAVNEQIAIYTNDEHMIGLGMSFETKLAHFKRMLIAKDLMTAYDPVGHLLMGRSRINPVVTTYQRAQSADPKLVAIGKMITPGLAVATIALSQLATEYRDSFWEADYLMMGLRRHALEDQFPAIGELLVEFVMVLMTLRDTGSMKTPGPAGPDDEGR